MTTQPDDVTTFLSTWQAAEPSGDATALGEALDDDFTAFGPLGFALSKEDWLERHTTGAMKYETFALTELELRTTTASRLHGTPDRNGHLQRPPGSKRASGHDRLERHGRGLAARADPHELHRRHARRAPDPPRRPLTAEHARFDTKANMKEHSAQD